MQTIQTFVMDYVDEYVGEYNFVVYFFFVVVRSSRTVWKFARGI